MSRGAPLLGGGASLAVVASLLASQPAYAAPTQVVAGIAPLAAAAIAGGALPATTIPLSLTQKGLLFMSIHPLATVACAGLLLLAGLLPAVLLAGEAPAPVAPLATRNEAPAADLSAIPAWGGSGYSDNFTISPDGRWLVSDGIVFAMPDGRAVSLLCAPGKNSEWKRKPDVQGDALVDPASGWRTHYATLANMRQLHFSPDGRSLDSWHDLLLLRFPVDVNGIGPGIAITKFALPDVQTIRSSINTVMTVTDKHGQSRGVRIERGVVVGDDGGFDGVNWMVTSELNRLEQDGLVQKYPSGAWIWTRENARVWRTGKTGWSPLDLDYRPFHVASDPSGQRMAVWHNGGINAVSIYTIEGMLIRRWVMGGHFAGYCSHLAWLPGDRLLVSGAANGDDGVWWELSALAPDDRLPPPTAGWPVIAPDGSPAGAWQGQTLTLKDRGWTIALPSKPTWGKGMRPMTDASGRWFIMYLGAGGLLVVDLTTGKVCHPAAGVTLARLGANSQF